MSRNFDLMQAAGTAIENECAVSPSLNKVAALVDGDSIDYRNQTILATTG